MIDDDEWEEMIVEGQRTTREVVNANAFVRSNPAGSFANPPLLGCDDGFEYWVKYSQAIEYGEYKDRTGRLGGMVADRVMAKLAEQMEMEVVPPARLVMISHSFRMFEEARLPGACSGLAHGSRNASANCTGRMDLAHNNYCFEPINRPRYADLAVLYGLGLADDRQVIFSLVGDPLVHSVDHGHFFPCGPHWDAAGLSQQYDGALDPHVVSLCRLTKQELDVSLQKLQALTANQIAFVVAQTPAKWAFPMTDRVAVARFLWARRGAILNS